MADLYLEPQTESLLQDLEGLKVCVELIDVEGRVHPATGVVHEREDGRGFDICPDGEDPILVGEEGMSLRRFSNPALERPPRHE